MLALSMRARVFELIPPSPPTPYKKKEYKTKDFTSRGR